MAKDKRSDAKPTRPLKSARELTRTADTINVDPQALATAIPASATLADRYKIICLLGRGGFGSVYLATDTLSGAQVAVKLLTERTPAQRDLFRREAGLLRFLRLPGIVRLIDADEHLGQPYLVTELITGVPFPGSGPKTWGEIEETVIAFFEALDRVHTHGVLHLDLKPSNVLVKDNGEPVILDFGVAIPPLSRPGEVPVPGGGTPVFMAPEQLTGRPVSPKADLYAAGVMLLRSLSGQPVFTQTAMAELLDAKLRPPSVGDFQLPVPSKVVRLIESMIAPDPKDRPESARVIADQLSHGATPAVQLTAALGANESATMETLRGLFHGPEIVFHLPSDAAAALARRAGRDPGDIAREVTSWVRAGLCFWDGDRLRIERDAIDRLQAGLVVRSPEVYEDEPPSVPVATADYPLVGGGTRGWTDALPRGGMTKPLAEMSWEERRARMTASPRKGMLKAAIAARRAARLGLASALVDAALTSARGDGAVAEERQVLTELAKLAIERQTVEAIDLALFEFDRAPDEARSRHVRALLEAARAVRSGGSCERMKEKAGAVDVFPELELERLRRGQVVLAAQRGSVAEHAVTVEETLEWADRTGGASLTAAVRGWAGFLEYRRGNYRESALQCAFAAEHADTVLSRLSALSNLAMALLETTELGEGLKHTRRGIALSARIRLPLFELRFRRMEREFHYRMEGDLCVDEELVIAAQKVDHPTESGPALLNQSAVAWRLGALNRSRELALAAARSFGAASSSAGVVLAHSLAAAAGAPCLQAEAERRLEAAARGPAGVLLQARALYRHAGIPIAPLNRVVRGHLPSGQRGEVLSVDECRRAWSVDAPSGVL